MSASTSRTNTRPRDFAPDRNLDVSAVVAIIDEQNVASRQVAERAGFVLDGRAEPWGYSETGIMLRYLLDGRTLSGLSASGMTQ